MTTDECTALPICVFSASSESPEWTWQLMNALGGKAPSGALTVPTDWSVKRGYVPAYTWIWNDPGLKTAWAKWVDVDVLKTQIENAVHSSVVIPASYQNWYPQWLDFTNIALQDCVTGKISADQACDRMSEKAEQLAKAG